MLGLVGRGWAWRSKAGRGKARAFLFLEGDYSSTTERHGENMKAEELLARVEKLAEVEASALPLGHVHVWFSIDGKGPCIFQIGKTNPLDEEYRVLALFQSETEVRIYSFRTSPPKSGESDKPKRHTVHKMAPTCFGELLTLKTFVAEWCDELRSLDRATADVEKDEEGKEQLISALDDDDDDDPEPEPETETEPEPVPGAPPAE